MGKLMNWTREALGRFHMSCFPWTQQVASLSPVVQNIRPPPPYKLAPSPITSNWASETQN